MNLKNILSYFKTTYNLGRAPKHKELPRTEPHPYSELFLQELNSKDFFTTKELKKLFDDEIKRQNEN